MLQKKTIEDIDLNQKRVLVRVDFNVPLNDALEITDTLRIDASLPTINYLLSQHAKVILMSHLGRPKGMDDKLRMRPVYNYLKTKIKTNVFLATDCVGSEVEKMAMDLKSGEILLLENLRFHPEEEKNDPEFVQQLAKLGEIYVNDAFGTAHRSHASTEGVAHVLPAVAGYLMEKEINYLQNTIDNPKHPFIAILGGKKVSDKILVLKQLLTKVNSILLGGGMVYTFFKAQGKQIGNSIVDIPGIETAKEIMALAEKSGKKIIFPVDIITAKEIKQGTETKICLIDDGIPDGWQGLDIGPKSVELFGKTIKESRTILWNGPVGVFEIGTFALGTKKIADIIANNSEAISIIGGGDTASAVKEFGLESKITHISTGGGASLELLEGKILPGVKILQDK
ncbi:MAG: phosphoglycerate kinase [Candidatus Thorarchaeota archaeon]